MTLPSVPGQFAGAESTTICFDEMSAGCGSPRPTLPPNVTTDPTPRSPAKAVPLARRRLVSPLVSAARFHFILYPPPFSLPYVPAPGRARPPPHSLPRAQRPRHRPACTTRRSPTISFCFARPCGPPRLASRLSLTALADHFCSTPPNPSWPYHRGLRNSARWPRTRTAHSTSCRSCPSSFFVSITFTTRPTPASAAAPGFFNPFGAKRRAYPSALTAPRAELVGSSAPASPRPRPRPAETSSRQPSPP